MGIYNAIIGVRSGNFSASQELLVEVSDDSLNQLITIGTVFFFALLLLIVILKVNRKKKSITEN